MSDVLEKTDTKIDTTDGDHDVFSHYVKKEDILEAAINGKQVRALCGKMWTPVKDPEKYPVCPDCKKVYERLLDE